MSDNVVTSASINNVVEIDNINLKPFKSSIPSGVVDEVVDEIFDDVAVGGV
jgi:hypothetical protein